MNDTTVTLLFTAAIPGTIALLTLLNKLCKAYEQVIVSSSVARVRHVDTVFRWLINFRTRVLNIKIVSLKYLEWKGDEVIFHGRHIYLGGYWDECIRIMINAGGANE
ncbi:hypothetical protein HOY82DRAFT_614665 [Tuber indicum]|nr:hypothetical protein HOY82DRAFT_614665 [Tuber indicum]